MMELFFIKFVYVSGLWRCKVWVSGELIVGDEDGS